MLTMLRVEYEQSICMLTLNDPSRRNALNSAIFDALDHALHILKSNETISVILLRGEGSVFCAGFDLNAVAADHALLGHFILRLSAVNNMLRNLPQIVIAAVQGAALAGGCAMISACDLVLAESQARFGYPVHRIGISPAVTIPTLQQAIGAGASRSLLLSGELISADEALRLGLVDRILDSPQMLEEAALELARETARKGAHALAITKRWLAELDESNQAQLFDQPAIASARAADGQEARMMVQKWASHASQASQAKQ